MCCEGIYFLVIFPFSQVVECVFFSMAKNNCDLLLLHLSLLSILREDVHVRFPVPSGASSRPANYHIVENQMKELKGKREKLLEDLQRERQMLDHAKLAFDRKKQEFVMFLAQSSSYATQVTSDPM